MSLLRCKPGVPDSFPERLTVDDGVSLTDAGLVMFNALTIGTLKSLLYHEYRQPCTKTNTPGLKWIYSW